MTLEIQSPASATAKWSHETTKIVLDSTELERFQGKIVELGKIKKTKFLIVCDGKGNIKVREIRKWTDKLKELEKMKDSLSEEQYEKIKKKIIDDEIDS